MSDGGEDHVNWIMRSGFAQKLTEILQRKNVEYAKPTLHIFSNLVKNPEYRVSCGKIEDMRSFEFIYETFSSNLSICIMTKENFF